VHCGDLPALNALEATNPVAEKANTRKGAQAGPDEPG
jgi:hypothetical protein